MKAFGFDDEELDSLIKAIEERYERVETLETLLGKKTVDNGEDIFWPHLMTEATVEELKRMALN